MRERFVNLLPTIFFVLITVIIFRDFFTKNLIPFPSNLLVSFYQPWESYYEQGVANKPIGFDNLRIFYPLRTLSIELIKNFTFPLWNPYTFSGNTQLATYQSAIFHPLSFLFFTLNQPDAWSIIIIIQFILASQFMHLFLREIGISGKGALFGALSFGFSGFMIVWAGESFMVAYAALFFPLILYAIKNLMKKNSWVNVFLLVFGLAASMLSGSFQISLYVFLFSLCWFFFLMLTEKANWQTFLHISISYLLAILISSIQLFPSIEAYYYSARFTSDAKFLFDNYLVPWNYLITLIAPDFYGNPGTYNYFGIGFYHEKILFFGLVPFFFALHQILNYKQSPKEGKFFTLIVIATLLLGVASPISWFFLYALRLPFFSSMLPSRIFFITAFSFIVLASFGIDVYLKKQNVKKFLPTFFFIGLMFFVAGGYVWFLKEFGQLNKSDYSNNLVSFRNLVPPIVVYVFLLCTTVLFHKSTRLQNGYVFLLLLHITYIFYFSNKFLYFSNRRNTFPDNAVLSQLQKISGIYRFLSIGKERIESNFSVHYKLYSPEGYDAMFIKRYGEFINTFNNNGKVTDQLSRSDIKLPHAENIVDLYNHPDRQKLLSLLGIKYVVGKKEAMKNKSDVKTKDIFTPVWQDNEFVIYEYKRVFPRAFLAGSYIILNDRQKIIDTMFAKGIDLSKTLILEQSPQGVSNTMSIKGKIQIHRYNPTEIELGVSTESPALLFLSDNYFPGWHAYVDGRKEKILRANYSFRAVVVPKGNHRVSFRYEPASFFYGLIISTIGLIGLVWSIIKLRSQKTNEKITT